MSDEKKSTHRAEVYDFKMEKHPNPESTLLSVVRLDGYTCVVKTQDWVGVTKCVHIQPDSLVEVIRPEFQFLIPLANGKEEYRVKAKKLKGVASFGFLIPVPDDTPIGEDWSEKLGIKHYEPKVNNKRSGYFGGEAESPPEGLNCIKYDLENGRKYGNKAFIQDEEVLAVEKCHGSQAAYVFTNGRMWCRSKNEWKREYPSTEHLTIENLTPKVGEEKAKEIVEKINSKPAQKNLWWKVLENVPEIEKWCRNNPDLILYGEITGVQGKGFEYGTEPGKPGFAAFDIFKDRNFLDYDDMAFLLKNSGIPLLPVLYRGPYNFEKMCQLAEGKTVYGKGKGVIEGVVVRPTKERYDYKYGRVVLKWVGVGYLEKDQPENNIEE